MKNGITASDSRVSCQLIRNIAMIVLIATATLLVRLRRGVGDDGLDAADVVGEAALDLAGLASR